MAARHIFHVTEYSIQHSYHHYFKNIFYSDIIQLPLLVLRTYHLIMSYKHGTFNV